ncbi:MAG TPA: hypothetical protein VF401_01485 [Candidatus Saccharimonadales bacterium]
MKPAKQGVIHDQAAPETKADREHRKAAKDLSQTKTDQDGPLTMAVRIYSPFRVYFDGPAFSLSAENATGPFDILPEHHNFISLLSPCDLVVRTQTNEQKVTISGGIMHVKADEVVVFLDV